MSQQSVKSSKLEQGELGSSKSEVDFGRSASTVTIAESVEDRDKREKAKDANVNIIEIPLTPEFKTFSKLESLYICPLTPCPKELEELDPCNSFEIYDYEGSLLFYVLEKSSDCQRRFCSDVRSFKYQVYDLEFKHFLDIRRPHSCFRNVFGMDSFLFCGNRVIISEPGRIVGSIDSTIGIQPAFKVVVFEGIPKMRKTQFIINGPCWTFCSPWATCSVTEVKITLPYAWGCIGKIRIGYDGLDDHLVPHPKTVSVIFPPKCTPDTKACFLAAGFMIDLLYFQDGGWTLHRKIRTTCMIISTLAIITIGLLVYFLIFAKKEK